MIRIHVTIECPNVTDCDGEGAEWAVARVSDVMERAGLEDEGCSWWIDDTTEGGAA